MPSEILRSQLCSLAEGVNEAYALINPDTIIKEFQQTREQLVSQYMRQERKEHMHLLNRKSVIEARKEKIENMRTNQVIGHIIWGGNYALNTPFPNSVSDLLIFVKSLSKFVKSYTCELI